MDNLPPELQSRLKQLDWCIKNQLHQSSQIALGELTSLLDDHYQCFQKAHAALQQLHSSTQTRQIDLPRFVQKQNHAQNQTQQKTKTHG